MSLRAIPAFRSEIAIGSKLEVVSSRCATFLGLGEYASLGEMDNTGSMARADVSGFTCAIRRQDSKGFQKSDELRALRRRQVQTKLMAGHGSLLHIRRVPSSRLEIRLQARGVKHLFE